MKQILVILGTRPEAIKLAPVIIEMKKSEKLSPLVCLTGQHKEMLDQVMNFFSLKADYDIKAMTNNQSLNDLSAVLLREIDNILGQVKPDLVMVQGDTTSSMVGALCSFHRRIEVAHVEAGLRSFQKRSPFPEEINRRIIGQIADIHFCPTRNACNQLQEEGIPIKKIHMVGNTVVDALLHCSNIVKKASWEALLPKLKLGNLSKKIILVTCHRRESFGKTLRDICAALCDLAKSENIEIVYPVHLNPNVRDVVFDMLSGVPNIHLVDPLDYAQMVFLMNKCYLILTDSGGIQEEGPTLMKPVLIMRDVTERMEGVEAGVARLVGTDCRDIVEQTKLLIHSRTEYGKMATGNNPYGDGKSSSRIREVLETTLGAGESG